MPVCLITSYVLFFASPVDGKKLIGLVEQVNETELEVSSDSASYKQRLEVLQQQEELIEDEQEQEEKEAEARRVKKEAEEDAKREAEEKREAEQKEKDEAEVAAKEKGQAEEMLPEEQAKEIKEEQPKEEVDVRMTAEQVQELGSALEILSAKSSVIKERTELRRLIEENEKAEAEEVSLRLSSLSITPIADPFDNMIWRTT